MMNRGAVVVFRLAVEVEGLVWVEGDGALEVEASSLRCLTFIPGWWEDWAVKEIFPPTKAGFNMKFVV